MASKLTIEDKIKNAEKRVESAKEAIKKDEERLKKAEEALKKLEGDKATADAGALLKELLESGKSVDDIKALLGK